MSVDSTPELEYFESQYRRSADPYDYYSVGEQAKYAGVLAAVRKWQPNPTRVLEAACGLGYVTRMLADCAPQVWAYDISPTAVERTRERCADVRHVQVDVGDALAPAYPRGSFDAVIMGDVGLFSRLDDRARAIREALALLNDRGVLILTDCIKGSHQAEYTAFVEAQGAVVLERLYFHDRYWMKFRSLVKSVGGESGTRRFLSSPTLHRWLTGLGKLRGAAGSKHYGLVVRRGM